MGFVVCKMLEIEDRLHDLEHTSSENSAALTRIGREVREHEVRIKDLNNMVVQHSLDIQKTDFKSTLTEQIAATTKTAFDQHEIEGREQLNNIHSSLKGIEVEQVKQSASFIRYAFIAWGTLAMTVGGGIITLVWALVTGKIHAFFGL